jgi:hypothetical protein
LPIQFGGIYQRQVLVHLATRHDALAASWQPGGSSGLTPHSPVGQLERPEGREPRTVLVFQS